MQLQRKVWTALALICSLVISILGISAAHAAPNPGVVVTAEKLFRVDASSAEIPGKLRQWGSAQAVFGFDATEANPIPGDSFSVTLPKELHNYQVGKRVDLKYGDIVAGDCVQETPSTIVCTFNEAIRGKTDVKGTVEATLHVSTTTDAKSLEFNLNGKLTQVPLPGGGGIDDGIGEFEPTRSKKWIGTILEGSSNVRYEILFNSRTLPADLGGPDGVNKVVWKDTLSEGQYFDESKGFKLVLLNDPSGKKWTQLATLAGPADTSRGTFNISVEYHNPAKPTEATITATGPFSPDANYYIQYYSKFDNPSGTPQAGRQYSNSAKLVNSSRDVVVSVGGRYIESLKANVEFKDGFGGFEVTKLIDGERAGEVAADTKFTTSVAWELPEGKTAADYPGWAAPANPVQLEVTLGKVVAYPGTFPAGTKLTIVEDPMSAAPAANVAWGEPVFQVNGVESKGSAVVTVENKTSVAVELTNIANPPTVPEPTPTPTPSPTPEPTPTPTPEPTPTPTPSPEPTPTPEPMPTPSASPTPTPTPSKPGKPGLPKTGD